MLRLWYWIHMWVDNSVLSGLAWSWINVVAGVVDSEFLGWVQPSTDQGTVIGLRLHRHTHPLATFSFALCAVELLTTEPLVSYCQFKPCKHTESGRDSLCVTQPISSFTLDDAPIFFAMPSLSAEPSRNAATLSLCGWLPAVLLTAYLSQSVLK